MELSAAAIVTTLREAQAEWTYDQARIRSGEMPEEPIVTRWTAKLDDVECEWSVVVNPKICERQLLVMAAVRQYIERIQNLCEPEEQKEWANKAVVAAYAAIAPAGSFCYPTRELRTRMFEIKSTTTHEPFPELVKVLVEADKRWAADHGKALSSEGLTQIGAAWDKGCDQLMEALKAQIIKHSQFNPPEAGFDPAQPSAVTCALEVAEHDGKLFGKSLAEADIQPSTRCIRLEVTFGPAELAWKVVAQTALEKQNRFSAINFDALTEALATGIRPEGATYLPADGLFYRLCTGVRVNDAANVPAELQAVVQALAVYVRDILAN